jgi:uncharacterized protein (UPF0332 family)
MIWKDCIELKKVERRTPDKQLAKSLFKIATKRIDFFRDKEISIFVLEGVYEAIIELCHAILTLNGYKTLSHECVIEFLRGRYLTDYEVEFLQRLRKKRHRAKYYGKIFSKEVIRKNVEIAIKVFFKLETLLKKELKKIRI